VKRHHGEDDKGEDFGQCEPGVRRFDPFDQPRAPESRDTSCGRAPRTGSRTQAR
jgi:hypothetical protein